MDAADLAGCVERARSQDPEASRNLIDRLYPLVIRIVRAHLPRRMAEEDLAQEIFLRIFSRLEQYAMREGVPFTHWVSRLAVRTCLDALRAERRRPEVRWSDLDEAQQAWLDHLACETSRAPEGAPASAREMVDLLLSQLSAPDRLVLSLLDLQQKTVAEISTLTGWAPTLVKVRAFRARRKLRRIAARLHEEMPDE